MNLYAESSAVLSWLLGEDRSIGARGALAGAELVLASELTLIECDRVLIRASSGGRLSEVQRVDLRSRLEHVAGHWSILGLSEEIVDRARRPFPVEPVRTLDAIHLATALLGRSLIPGLGLLSLDERVRANGRELGFDLLP
ncbi:MAG: type II toxin-antitoxin system VapC family toxin [Acidobacteria bacterium]|nr:type II toxin-antitoxin system VapC family toxin [Acidobacteriota bacterium]